MIFEQDSKKNNSLHIFITDSFIWDGTKRTVKVIKLVPAFSGPHAVTAMTLEKIKNLNWTEVASSENLQVVLYCLSKKEFSWTICVYLFSLKPNLILMVES